MRRACNHHSGYPTVARRDRAREAVYCAGHVLHPGRPMRWMATTLVATWLMYARAIVVHVGDSRCYRMRGRSLLRFTRDHRVGNVSLRDVSTVAVLASRGSIAISERALSDPSCTSRLTCASPLCAPVTGSCYARADSPLCFAMSRSRPSSQSIEHRRKPLGRSSVRRMKPAGPTTPRSLWRRRAPSVDGRPAALDIRAWLVYALCPCRTNLDVTTRVTAGQARNTRSVASRRMKLRAPPRQLQRTRQRAAVVPPSMLEAIAQHSSMRPSQTPRHGRCRPQRAGDLSEVCQGGLPK